MRRRLLLLAGLGLLLAPALGASALALPQSDNFGYVATAPSGAFGWTDISGTGTQITASAWVGSQDDGWVQVNLPFNFHFYGTAYAKAFLSSNGYVQFGSGSASVSPNCLNLNSAPLSIAAAYWMDLDPSSGGTVHEEVLGLAPNRSMVLQFTNVPPRLGTGSVTFQIVLNEDSSLDLVYVSTSSFDGGASAVAGLRGPMDCPNHLALPLSCLQADLNDSTIVHIAYPAVEPACGSPTLTDSPSLSPTFTLSFTRTDTPTISPTFSDSPTQSPSSTPSPTLTITDTFSGTATISVTGTISPTGTPTPSSTPTDPDSPTASITPTETPSFSASPSSTETPSVTATPTETPSFSASPTDSDTDSPTPTQTETPSFSASPTDSDTDSPTSSVTATPSPSPTASCTITPSGTGTASATPTPTLTPSDTITVTSTSSSSPTDSPSLTVTLTATATPTRTITTTCTASPTFTPTFTSTATLLPAAAKPACLVLGFSNYTSNALASASASSLNAPGAVALDTRSTPFRVYVSDTGNHRILYWNDVSALSLGSPADGVIGQSSFSGSSANQGGAVSATTLASPLGLAVDPGTGALWVADSGNQRVLRYSLPLGVSNSAADRVLGQGGSFSSASANLGGLSASSLNSPQALSCDGFGALAVADTGNHRVLRFASPGSISAANASWGQAGGFSTNGGNFGGIGPQSLSVPAGVLLLANQLWVADSGNHRLLRYDLNLPLTQSASVVLGQADYLSSGANRGFGLASNNSVNSPHGLGMDLSGRLLVGDSKNNRVLAFEPPFGPLAALVWGQSSLGANGPGVGNDGLSLPLGIAASGATLLVADSGNHRSLIYGCGAGLPANSPTSTFTATPSITASFSASPSSSATPTLSPSPSISPSFSQSPSFTSSATPSLTPTLTVSPSITLSFSASPSASVTKTASPTPTLTISQTVVPTRTPYGHSSHGVISYPNPALRSGGHACFAFPPASTVRVQLFDLLGQPVATLAENQINAALGVACWDLKAADGSTVAPGLYFVRVVADGQAQMAKLTVR